MKIDCASLISPSGIMKMVEIVFTLCCIILESVSNAKFGGGGVNNYLTQQFGISNPSVAGMDMNMDMEFVAGGALVMGLVVSTVCLLVYLTGGREHLLSTILEPIVCGIVGLLLLSVGSFTLHNCRAYQNPISNFASMFGQNSNAVFNQNSNFGNGNTYQECQALGSLCIIAAVAYIIDLVLAIIAYCANY